VQSNDPSLLVHPVYIRRIAPERGELTLLEFPVYQAKTFDAMRRYIGDHMAEVEEPKGLVSSYYYGYVAILESCVVGLEYK